MIVGPLQLLFVLALALSGGLASFWVDQTGHRRPELVWKPPSPLKPEFDAPQDPKPTDPDAGNPVVYAGILARPLFAPDRRPPPPPAPPAPPPPPDPLNSLKLMGIFTASNGINGLLGQIDGRMRRIKIDENVGAWTLKKIDGREALFKQGELERKVRLNYARIDAPSQAGVPSAPQARTIVTPYVGGGSMPQSVQEELRERLRRRNEMRIKNGLPPVTE